MFRLINVILPVAVCLAGSDIVIAQDAGGGASAFEEIVVTARKREESLEDIPVALTAFTEEDFAGLNMGDLYDVGKNVPNLFIGNFGNGNQNHTSVFMRGTGTQDHIITVDSAVGLYLDGVYLGRQVGSNLSLSGIERVEVARGPQGTLYGRNSIGGAINVITRKPGGADELTLTAQGRDAGAGQIRRLRRCRVIGQPRRLDYRGLQQA